MKYFAPWIGSGKKLDFLILIFLFVLLNDRGVSFVYAQGRSSIEIIVRGKKFDSIELYQESKQKSEAKGSKVGDSWVVSREGFLGPLFYFVADINNFRRIKQNFGGLPQEKGMDLRKQKFLGQYDRFFPAFAALSSVGFNTGVVRMIEAFHKLGDQAIVYKTIDRKDLANALDKSFPEGGYSGPILLISEKNKVRVLTLDSK